MYICVCARVRAHGVMDFVKEMKMMNWVQILDQSVSIFTYSLLSLERYESNYSPSSDL